MSTAEPASRTGTSPPIDVDGLTKRFGDHVAVDRVCFSILRGRICGFVGPNGSGKTTTLRMLLGLVTPTSGTARVLGEPISHPERYVRRVGSLIESPAFYGSLSGRDNLLVHARLMQLATREVDAALEAVDLADRAGDRYRSYSLGMRQRLAIAAALLGRPEVVILDEPSNGLDPRGIVEMRAMLLGLAAEGRTVVVTSHLLAELEQICDDVVIIHRGSLRFCGPLREYAARAAPTLRLRPSDPGQLGLLRELVSGLHIDATVVGDHVVARAEPHAGAAINRAAMERSVLLSELSPVRPTLEQIYFADVEPDIGRSEDASAVEVLS